MIRRVLLAASALMLTAPAANAAVVVNIVQEEEDVRLSFLGTLDVSGATYRGVYAGTSGLVARSAGFISASSLRFDAYQSISGPSSFGNGDYVDADFAEGDNFGILRKTSQFFVAAGYASGSAIEGSSVYNNATLASLGLQEGRYDFAIPNDTITVNIIGAASAAVPEPATWAMMIGGVAMIGAAARRRRTTMRVAYA